MSKKKLSLFVLLSAVFIVGCSSEPKSAPEAADTSTSSAKSLGVGDPAPAWSDLVGIDDQQHGLADLTEAKAVAVVFTCNHCPVAVAYEDRLIQLANDYQDQSFQLVAINVNNMEADKLPAMKVRAAEKGFQFPYLYDPSQTIGREYGATVTPHAFLLDADRNVVYMGAIDDSKNSEKVVQYHLRDAIDAILAGTTPATPSTQQFGCSIRYE
jgi:peroxiredoxin